MKTEKLKSFLESNYIVFIILIIGFLGWISKLSMISVPILAIIVSLTFIFCNDIKTTLSAIFFAPFFFNDLSNKTIVLFIISIALVVISIIFFVVKHLVKNKNITKGKMFWAFVISSIAFLIGGIFKNFNIVPFLMTLFLCIVCYILYWILINFSNNLKTFLNKLFIYGSIFLSLQIIYLFIATGNILQAINSRQVIWVGLQNVNAACLYITLGIISCFALGYKNKKDWLFFLLSLVFTLIICCTYCRLMILLSCIILVILTIITFIKSSNKKYFYIIFGLGILGVALLWIIFADSINTLIQSLLSRGIKLNGRDILWSWCWDMFKQFPIFGIGFYYAGGVPTMHVFHNLVLAHCTPLQWLTSLGIIGTLLMTFFYFKKYQIVFKNIKFSSFFLLVSIIMIEASGLVDQAAIMDPFVYLISLTLIASIEKENQLITEVNLQLEQK